MYAVLAGDYASVKLLLSWGADVNTQARDGRTALMSAITAARRAAFGIGKALMSAAPTGDYALVKLLLASGAEVDAKTDRGMTALMSAAYEGRNIVARTLIRAGADINVRSERTFPGLIRTPLILAVSGGHDMTVYLLLRQGAMNTDEESLEALRVSQEKGYRAIARMLKSAQKSGPA